MAKMSKTEFCARYASMSVEARQQVKERLETSFREAERHLCWIHDVERKLSKGERQKESDRT